MRMNITDVRVDLDYSVVPHIVFEGEAIELDISDIRELRHSNLHDYVAILNKKLGSIPEIKNVIFNDPATIVFWNDGTKTVVKAQEGDVFDPEKGLAIAISKKALGNKGDYCNELKKWLPKEEKKTCGTCKYNNVLDIKCISCLDHDYADWTPKDKPEAE